MRTLTGYAILAVIGFAALNLAFWLLKIAIGLLMKLVILAAIGFVFYLVLKLVSPGTARRVEETIKGKQPPTAA